MTVSVFVEAGQAVAAYRASAQRRANAANKKKYKEFGANCRVAQTDGLKIAMRPTKARRRALKAQFCRSVH